MSLRRCRLVQAAILSPAVVPEHTQKQQVKTQRADTSPSRVAGQLGYINTANAHIHAYSLSCARAISSCQ